MGRRKATHGRQPGRHHTDTVPPTKNSETERIVTSGGGTDATNCFTHQTWSQGVHPDHSALVLDTTNAGQQLDKRKHRLPR